MTTESEALDQLAELVEEQYPKGTTSQYGKELRHILHTVGRLNEPKPTGPFFVYLPSRGASPSGFDVYLVPSWDEARELQGESGIIREAQEANLRPGTLWGHRIPRDSKFAKFCNESSS